MPLGIGYDIHRLVKDQEPCALRVEFDSLSVGTFDADVVTPA